MERPVVIGVGYNILPAEYSDIKYIQHVIKNLQKHPLKIIQKASLYKTIAMGAPGQESYSNTAFLATTAMSPESLLRALKQTEQKFGRRGRGRPWSSRTLDLDLIDYKGLIRGYRSWHICEAHTLKTLKIKRGGLILPHAFCHERSFVLGPLMELIPNWRHPVLKKTVEELLRIADRNAKNSPGSIISTY